MSAPALLRGADLAAFAVALVARLRAGGVTVAASGPVAFVAAIRTSWPTSRTELYWMARLTLVNRADDLSAFDAVFAVVFADAVLPLDPVSLTALRGTAAAPVPGVGQRDDTGPQAGGLPWTTRPPSLRAAGDADDALAIPDVLPSRIIVRAEEPFEEFDETDLALIGSWLEQSLARWPVRRSLRTDIHRHGKRVDLRSTMRASRTTGFEPVRLARTRPRQRNRRLVLICDVSRSMQPYAGIYLHLMRTAALRQNGIRPEVFAFSTTLTRLTAVLAHRSPEVALGRANAKVTDRYGGTHLGRSIAELLSAPHGNTLRGAVVIIASDGWDSDPPAVIEHALARLKRRAAHLVWLNPRAAAPGFQPLAGSIAAAIPFCDAMVPANSLSGVRDLFEVLAAL